MKEKKIALLLFNVINMKSGGGTERQFTRFFNYYINPIGKKYKLYFILDLQTFSELQYLGLKNSEEVIIVNGGGKNNSLLKFIWNTLLLNISFISVVLKNKIDLIHLPLPNGPVLPALFFFSILKKIKLWYGKITINVTNCSLAHDYFSTSEIIDPRSLRNFKWYFHLIFLDGIYSWYQLFTDRSEKIKFLSHPKIFTAQFYFADAHIFTIPPKQNMVIFAGRLVQSKNPLLFVECIHYLVTNHAEFLRHNSWKFQMFGGGPLSEEIDNKIKKQHLSTVLVRSEKYNLKEDFSRSKIFVSLQDYENFTSLSLLEAMGCGNSVLAVNVGETERIIKDKVNGILCKTFDVREISEALFQLMNDSKLIEESGLKNNQVANHIHNIQNFTSDIEQFWKSILYKTTV